MRSLPSSDQALLSSPDFDRLPRREAQRDPPHRRRDGCRLRCLAARRSRRVVLRRLAYAASAPRLRTPAPRYWLSLRFESGGASASVTTTCRRGWIGSRTTATNRSAGSRPERYVFPALATSASIATDAAASRSRTIPSVPRASSIRLATCGFRLSGGQPEGCRRRKNLGGWDVRLWSDGIERRSLSVRSRS
jgi:hypothetical protein